MAISPNCCRAQWRPNFRRRARGSAAQSPCGQRTILAFAADAEHHDTAGLHTHAQEFAGHRVVTLLPERPVMGIFAAANGVAANDHRGVRVEAQPPDQ